MLHKIIYQEQIVHEHLTHLKYGNCGVDGTIEAALANQIGQRADVRQIGMTDQHGINVLHTSISTIIAFLKAQF